jgi:DNA repair protein RecO (recombination protein O)
LGLFTADAIVLDVVDLHDGDRILTFLTARRGKKRGVARGAKRKHSRFAGQLQPLSKVVVSWFEKSDRELARVSSVDLVRSADWLRRDLDDLLTGAYWAEHLAETTVENEDAEAQIRLLEASLQALAAGVPRGIVSRYFEVWALRLAGVFPSPAECSICGAALDDRVALAPGADGFLGPECVSSGTRWISRGALAFLRRAGRAGPEEFAGAKMSVEVLDEVEALCARVRRAFLQRELKSYEVLRQVGIASGLERRFDVKES